MKFLSKKRVQAFTLIEQVVVLFVFSVAASSFLSMYNATMRQAQSGMITKMRQENELAPLRKLIASVAQLNFTIRVYPDVSTATAVGTPSAVGQVVRFDRPDGYWFLVAYDAANYTLNIVHPTFTAPLSRAIDAFSADMGGGYLAVAVQVKGDNFVLKTDETF